MNRLPFEKRTLILKCLAEGMSVRSTCRLVDVAQNTVLSLLVLAGKVCDEYLDSALRNLPCRQIQADEIWSYVYAKDKNVPYVESPIDHAGTVWTWVAFDPETKLIATWLVGDRTTETAIALMQDLKPRLKGRIQLTTDGHRSYVDAVEVTFGADIDYAQIIKVFAEQSRDGNSQPTDTAFIDKRVISGEPDEDRISTSLVERQNLTMRTFIRRFTRRTNGFSKKLDNHMHAVALHVMCYNYCWIPRTLKVTPAMAAGITSTLWSIEDIAQMVEDATPGPGKRGSYRKKALPEKWQGRNPDRYTQVDLYHERMGLPPVNWEAELDRRARRAKEQREIMAEMCRETMRRREDLTYD